MKALIYQGPKEIAYKDVPEPVVEQGDALIKIDAVGICGSDMHAYLGHDERRPAPLILGHEAAGTVIEGKYKGQNVAINPLVTCGICESCLDGAPNLCASRQIISMAPRQGAFGEYLAIPERNLILAPAGMEASKVALAEPVATGYHAVFLAHKHARRPLAEARALVFGAGAVGLSAALVLKAYGCYDITIAETNAGRLETASQAGFDQQHNPLNDPSLNPSSFDIIIDAVGAKATRIAASAAVKPGGVIVHVGLLDGADGLDIRRITLQEIAFIGCYTYSMVDFKAALNALHSGALGALDWYEERPLSQGGQAFDDLLNARSKAAKIILKP
ncbi:MAG: alcohol dehydrogenase catalytic domain-containing protein [Alphaproteobacteria bacterium]